LPVRIAMHLRVRIWSSTSIVKSTEALIHTACPLTSAAVDDQCVGMDVRPKAAAGNGDVLSLDALPVRGEQGHDWEKEKANEECAAGRRGRLDMHIEKVKREK
jgi:hypothetical protein